MTFLRGIIIFVIGALLAAALWEQQEGKEILQKGVAALDAMRAVQQSEEQRAAAWESKEDALTDQRATLLQAARTAHQRYEAASAALQAETDAGTLSAAKAAQQEALAAVEQAEAALAAQTQAVLRLQRHRRVEKESAALRRRLTALLGRDRGRAWYGAQTATITEQLRVCESLADKERARLATRDKVPPQGVAAEPPPRLPEKFQLPILRETVETVIKTGELNAHIDDVDCAEYPCIVFGAAADKEAVRTLHEQLTVDYAGAAVHRLVEPVPGDDEGWWFAFVVRPYERSTESSDVLVAADRRAAFEALGARLRYRIQRYRQMHRVP